MERNIHLRYIDMFIVVLKTALLFGVIIALGALLVRWRMKNPMKYGGL